MLLNALFLQDVGDVNTFSYATDLLVGEGDASVIYFQLIDASAFRPEKGFVPGGRRYMPANGATVTVTFGNVDDAKKVTRVASQPFVKDPSIWSVNILSTDAISAGSVDMKIVLNESGTIHTGKVTNCIKVF